MSDQTQKADGGKHNPMILQEDFVFQLAVVNAVLEYGLQKYGQRGGWKQVDPERYKAAGARHRQAIMMGETLDYESGLPHWAHSICNDLFLSWFETDNLSFEEKLAMCQFNLPPQCHRESSDG